MENRVIKVLLLAELKKVFTGHRGFTTVKFASNGCKTSNLFIGYLDTVVRVGGSGPLMSPLPTKLLLSWEDIGTDHPDVPAELFICD